MIECYNLNPGGNCGQDLVLLNGFSYEFTLKRMNIATCHSERSEES